MLFRDKIMKSRNLVGMQGVGLLLLRLGKIPSRLDQGGQRAERFGPLEEGVLLCASSVPRAYQHYKNERTCKRVGASGRFSTSTSNVLER